MPTRKPAASATGTQDNLHHPALPSLVVAFAGAACASVALPLDTPKDVRALAIAPYEMHEDCMRLIPGDRIDYRFATQRPVSFNIRYRDGNTVVIPVSRDWVTEYAGVYAVVIAQNYCLLWESGQQGALLDYRLRIRRGE